MTESSPNLRPQPSPEELGTRVGRLIRRHGADSMLHMIIDVLYEMGDLGVVLDNLEDMDHSQRRGSIS